MFVCFIFLGQVSLRKSQKSKKLLQISRNCHALMTPFGLRGLAASSNGPMLVLKVMYTK